MMAIASSALAAQRGIAMSSGLTSGGSNPSMAPRAHSSRPGHIFPHQDQWRVLEMPHLQQLPDHHRLQDRADPSRRHDECVGREHELVQAREEGPVLERLGHERIHVLLEGEVDADPDGLGWFRRGRGSLVGGLHEPGATPR
jgi:hypothetical protein